MATSFPPIEAVHVRGAGASHEGPVRTHNEDAFGFYKDDAAALAVVADGMGAMRSGRNAADLTIETCAQIFQGRTGSVLDELAEAWWRGEHGTEAPAPGVHRARPFTALPISDRVELRERVRVLLQQRVPDSMGDVAVLEAELASFLGIPARALERANAAIHRLAEKDSRWRGHGATAACVIFAAGRASISHAGDCRVARVRRGKLEVLTTEHTLRNDYRNVRPEVTVNDLDQLPANVLTRALGMRDTVETETRVEVLERGDVYIVASDGFWLALPEKEILAGIRKHGVKAAPELVGLGKRARPDHPGDNLAAVIVEIEDPGTARQDLASP